LYHSSEETNQPIEGLTKGGDVAWSRLALPSFDRIAGLVNRLGFAYANGFSLRFKITNAHTKHVALLVALLALEEILHESDLKIQFLPHSKTHLVLVVITSLLMLCRKRIAVYCEIHCVGRIQK
jgi:hypothetical protein